MDERHRGGHKIKL